MAARKPTLKDIAEATGLSISTVSRALRGHGSINLETRRQVKEEASKLNYPIGGRAARTAELGRDGVGSRAALGFQTMAVVLRGAGMGRFFGESILALFDLGKTRGFELEIVQSEMERDLAEVLAEVTTDTAVVFSMDHVEYREKVALKEIKVPFVLVNRHGEDVCSAVTLDDFSAGMKAARFLCSLGHRHIGYIPGMWTGTATLERDMGFRAGLEMWGCYDPAYFSPPVSGNEIEPVRRHVLKLLSMTPRATALATYNDALATAALVALRDAGLRIPDDFSVVGFDHFPEYYEAKLTTFDYRYRDLAEHAVYLLDGLVTGTIRGPARVTLMPRFIEGATTGPAPTGSTRPDQLMGRCSKGHLD